MSKIIAIAMQKGGVGKTTTTVNLSRALVEAGKTVLAVDLDPQGNLTQHVGLDPEDITPTIYQSLKAEVDGMEADIRVAIHETPEGFDLLPSQPELSLVELLLMNTLSREHIVTTLLDPVRDEYDYILIDCNPSLGLLVVNALTAADSVIVPIQTEYLAARGAHMIMTTIETIKRKRLNPTITIEGILLTMADTRTMLTKEIMTAIQSQFGDGYRIFEPIVRRSVRFAESAAAGESLLRYSPSSQGAKAYRQIAEEIINGEA